MAYCLVGERFNEGDLYVMINAYWKPVTFYIQEGRVGERRRIVDTAQLSPQDIVEPGQEQPFGAPTYEVQPRSVVVLATESRAGT